MLLRYPRRSRKIVVVTTVHQSLGRQARHGSKSPVRQTRELWLFNVIACLPSQASLLVSLPCLPAAFHFQLPIARRAVRVTHITNNSHCFTQAHCTTLLTTYHPIVPTLRSTIALRPPPCDTPPPPQLLPPPRPRTLKPD